MNRIITLLGLFFSLSASAQVYTGSPGAITNDGQYTYFNLSVSGLSPSVLDSSFGLEEVCVNIAHTNVSELFIYLSSPDGLIVELTSGSSCGGVNYTNTCFKNSASSSVTIGTSPYTGNFRPIGYLGRFQNGQSGNGLWKLIIKDAYMSAFSGSVISWSINFSASAPDPVVFTSSDRPLVILNTGGTPIGDDGIYADLGIIYNGVGVRNYLTDPFNNYNAKAWVKLRGTSTRNCEKKSYNLELRSATGLEFPVPILGMPDESDWVLQAPYLDKSLLRIPLAYDLFRSMGHYAARSITAEVMLNNEYIGLYNVLEKLKRDPDRIDIAKLTPTENTYPGITGGYIFKIDRPDEPGWTSLMPGNSTTASHFHYQYVYPKDSLITVPQMNYIKSFVDSFEIAMDSPTFADPIVGYPKYIDVGSFVDYFIISELSKNVDAYRLSTYLYKDKITKGGKLHIGPVWDYDIAFHNCNYGDTFNPYFWQYPTPDNTLPSPTWWSRFMSDTNFVNALYCRWTNLRQNVLSISSMNAYIDSSVTAMNEAQVRNFTQWPVLGAYLFPNPQNQIGATYAAEVDDVKTWLQNRVSWMDGAITGICMPTEVPENFNKNDMVVYPNPFSSSTTFRLRLEKSSDVFLRIVDVMGKEVFSREESDAPAGELSMVFERREMASGIYFYKINVNGAEIGGKIIISE